MARYFVDTNIPMYAAGRAYRHREPCRGVIEAIVEGEIDAVTDTEVFQEILYRFLRTAEVEKGFRIFDNFAQILAGRILSVEPADLFCARELAETHENHSPRDLLHAAVMQERDIRRIVTVDEDFESIDDVERVAPGRF